MKKLSIRLLAAVVAALMLLCVLVACSDQTDDPAAETTTASNNSGDDTADPSQPKDVDEKGYKLDNIPDDLNYNKTKITTLYWSDREHEEFFAEGISGDNIDDAFYNRNITVEDRLGITMDFVGELGDSGNSTAWNTFIYNTLQAGNDVFDVMAGYSLSVAVSASKGYCYDLLDDDCEYLDFDMPWWPERLITEATINNKLYFCSGDISANALYMMYVCFVNKDIVDDNGLPDVYKLVADNQWTYEKFIEMCSNVYVDQDGDGIKSVGDRFGYMSSGIHTDPWFYGSGALIVDKDKDGNPKMAETFGGEKVIKTIEMFNDLFYNSSDAIYTTDVEHQRQFNYGNLLFTVDRCRISFKVFDNLELKFAIVPVPKYDAAQEKFVTTMGNPFTLYAIPIDAKPGELEMLSAFLETYASESYRQVTPEVYEVSLKLKYAQEDNAAKMYDIIRENISFDIGRIFSKVLINQSAFRDCFKNGGSSNYASQVKGLGKSLPKLLDKLISAYED